VVWADASGLNAGDVALQLLARAAACAVTDVRAGISRVPVAAELAARSAAPQTAVVVDEDVAAFIAPLGLDVLMALRPGNERLLTLLEGVGIRSCGELAALEGEAVEVRFGADAVELWQLARGDDRQRVFQRIAPERLHAGTEFVDYVVTDPERLVFVANSLFSSVCDQLRARGEHARRVLLTLSLGNRTSWQRTIRPARLVRAIFERLTVPDAVTGVEIEVLATEAATAIQGDLFDPGFATAAAVDDAVARLIELQGNVIVTPDMNAHPLIEERAVWQPSDALATVAASVTVPEMRLQLLPEPREVLVETVTRRDHVVPVRFRDGRWKQLVSAAGPDRISGGKWDEAYAREYFRAVTVEGQLVWLYRDGRKDCWYLHGWWD
jgi:hypothetical protein